MLGVRSLFSSIKRGRKRDGAKRPRLRLFVWTMLTGLVFGAIEFGEPLEDLLRIGRNVVRQHDASGQFVILGIDDKSLDHVKEWPWPRGHHATLVDNLNRLGARSIFFDLDFSSKAEPRENRIFAEAIARSKRPITLANRFIIDPATGERTDNRPLAELSRNSRHANINFRYNGQGQVWKLPYGLVVGGSPYPSFAAAMAGVHGPLEESFTIDYSVDPTSVPTVSAIDLMAGRVPAEAISGKTVVIGTTAPDLGDVYSLPGYFRMSGVYLHVLGAETLKAGAPVDIGWLPPFLAALTLAGLSLRSRRIVFALAPMFAGIACLLVIPLALEEHRIATQVMPAIFFLLVVGGSLGWTSFRQAYRLRGTTNVISGLPNLNALRHEDVGFERPLIAARFHNYAEVTSALPPGEEKELVEQIAGRLTIGRAAPKLYQGDEGIFAWFEEEAFCEAIADQLDALHALFRSPVKVAGKLLDLAVTFGLDGGSERSLTNRLGSALVAADEAAAEGLKWKAYDPAKLKDASWKLSLLSQLDAAIDAEELWVAYQPKLDLRTRKLIGAEALVRWTHPQKGPISPLEFVVAAEQSDRIEKLTAFVLERSVAAAAAINRRGIDFDMSVNLSARLIDDAELPSKVLTVLRRHGLKPEHLTLEVTETAALNTSGSSIETLLELRGMGVQISIDDYGTGLSTLDYLKRIPATEIKIDKSFVQALWKSRSDKLLVHSTIQLAHSLGQKVVAEGIEDATTLEHLTAMGCDVAQGYFIGRPMKIRALLRMLLGERKEKAA